MDIHNTGVYTFEFPSTGQFLFTFEVDGWANLRIFYSYQGENIQLNPSSIYFDEGIYNFEVFGSAGANIIFQVLGYEDISDVYLLPADE